MKPRIAAFLAPFLCFGLMPTGDASAFTRGGLNLTCPKGSAFPDGCAGAATDGAFQVSSAFAPGGFFNTTTGSPTNYMGNNCTDAGNQPCRAPWNVAGVDYPVGYETTVPLQDPATANIPGCRYAVQRWGGGLMSCGGSSFGVGHVADVENLELGPIGGHGCTALKINNPVDPTPLATTLIVKNIDFFNDTALCSVGLTLLTAIYINSSSYTGTISQLSMDGNSQVFGSSFDPGNSQPANARTNPIGAFRNEGGSHITVQYAYIHNFAGDPVVSDFVATAYTELRYSVIHGWCLRAPTCHSEYWSGGGGKSTAGIRGEISDYNVIIRDWFDSTFGPAPHWYASTWNNPQPIDLLEYSNNTQINSYAGLLSGPGRIYLCAGGQPTGGTATNPTCDTTSPDGIAYLTQGVAGQGNIFICGSNTISFYKEIPGPYPVTTPPIIDEFEMENPNSPVSAASYYPNFTLAGVKCRNVTVTSDMVGDAGVIDGHGGNPITQAVIHDNYIDASSSKRNPTMYLFVDDRTGVSFTGTIATSAGVSTLTSTSGLTFKGGETIDTGSCDSISITNCPTIQAPGGTGTTFTLNTVVAAITTPTSMTWNLLNVCTNPVSLSGNISSAPGAFTDAWMNSLSPASRNRPGEGC